MGEAQLRQRGPCSAVEGRALELETPLLPGQCVQLTMETSSHLIHPITCFLKFLQGTELNDRLSELLGLEGTSKNHVVPAPLPWAGTLSLIRFDQVAPSPICPGLEHFHEGHIHGFSGQPAPVPHYPHGKERLPYIKLEVRTHVNLMKVSAKGLAL